MNVTDTRAAQSAATVVVGALAASVAMTIVSVFVLGLLMQTLGLEAWLIGSQLVWLVIEGGLALGLFQLAGALGDEHAGVTRMAAVTVVVSMGVDLVMTVLERAHLLPGGRLSSLGWDLNLAVSLVMRLALLFTFVRLSSERFAWVVPLAATVALLTVARTAITVAQVHQLIDPELRRGALFLYGLPAISIFNTLGVLGAGLALRAAVGDAPSVQGVVAASGLRPSEPEAVSPAADFVVGGILLVVGVAVTALSYASAAGGGRYLIATGAIGVGVARLIRGLIRLGKAQGGG